MLYYSLIILSHSAAWHSLVSLTKSLLRSPLQVHLAVYRAVSAFTTAFAKSTGSVNTFLVSHSPLFLVPLLALDINGHNDRNDTVSTTDNNTSTLSIVLLLLLVILHSYYSYSDRTSSSFSLYTQLLILLMACSIFIWPAHSTYGLLILHMACSFFIWFVSTVRLAGEYCSELTHRDANL